MRKIIDTIDLPKGWKTYRLKSLGEIFKGKGISKSEVKNEGIPCIRYGEIYTKYNYHFNTTFSFIDENSAKESQEIKFGDILFAGSGEKLEDIGKSVAYIGKQRAFAGGDIVIFRPNTPESGLFFGYLLNSDYVIQQKTLAGQGHSVVHIYGKDIQNLKILLPPLFEQEKIAEILSKWDELIATQSQLIQAKQKQKKALMQKLLSGKLRFPGFTDKWEEKTLGEVVDVKKGEQLNKEFLTETGLYPCLNGGINPSGYTDKFNSEKNTITISEGGNSCGFVNFNTSRFWLGGHCYKIIPIKDLEIKYLYYLLKNNEVKIQSLRVGSGLPNIQLKDLKILKLIFAKSKNEQQKIAYVLSACDEEIETLKTELQSLQTQKKGLMQQLLTGKISVNG